MNRTSLYFLTLSFFTVICLFLIGVAIGQESILGIILSILGVVVFMGIGFRKKKQLREESK